MAGVLNRKVFRSSGASKGSPTGSLRWKLQGSMQLLKNVERQDEGRNVGGSAFESKSSGNGGLGDARENGGRHRYCEACKMLLVLGCGVPCRSRLWGRNRHDRE